MVACAKNQICYWFLETFYLNKYLEIVIWFIRRKKNFNSEKTNIYLVWRDACIKSFTVQAFIHSFIFSICLVRVMLVLIKLLLYLQFLKIDPCLFIRNILQACNCIISVLTYDLCTLFKCERCIGVRVLRGQHFYALQMFFQRFIWCNSRIHNNTYYS